MRFLRSTFVAGALCLGLLTLSSCDSSPEAKSARYIEKGKKLLAKHDVSRALLEFQNAVRASQTNPEAYYQLGKALLAANDVPHGIKALQKALEINPKHKNAQLELAKLMAITDDKGFLLDAQQRLRGILADAPDDPDALHSLALTELKLGDSDAAIRDLNHAVSVAPEHVLLAATLAQAKVQSGDFKGAEEVLKTAHEKSPKSVTAVVLMGRLYLTENRLSDAEQQIRAGLAMDPKNSNALYNLALVQIRAGRTKEAEDALRTLSRLPDKTTNSAWATFLFQNGRKDEAIKELERLAKEDPEDRMARTRLVWAYQSAGRESDAEGVLAAVLKKNPKDLDALLQRGEVFLSHGKYPEAEADLNRVLALKPTSPEVHYVLGRLYKARGEDLRYQQELTKALELNRLATAIRLELARSLTQPKTARAALEILDAEPSSSQKDSPEYLAARNWALWVNGDMAGLRKGIDKALAKQRTTEFLLQDGLWKLRSGNVAGARSALEEALRIDPQDIRALSALNESYEMQKQTAVAVEKVKEYAARQPKSVPVQDFLGSILMARGDRTGARTAFEAAKAVDPRSTVTDLALIQVDLLDGKVDHAQKGLEAFLTANPSSVTGRLWLGNVKSTRGDYKAAVDQYRAVLSADPGNAQALNNLAYILTEYENRPAEALKYAQKAKEISPESAEYSDTLGWVFYQLELYPSAVRELESASAKSTDPTLKFHLAMAYTKAGDSQRGRATLQAALKQNPRLPEADRAQRVVDGVPKSGTAQR